MLLIQGARHTISAVAAVDTIQLVAGPSSAAAVVAQWIIAGVGVFALILAAISAWWAATQWRLQYFTTEWSRTLKFLYSHPQFLDPTANRTYDTAFTGKDRQEYEIIARLSIGFVDDLHHLKMGKYLKSWFKGATRLFVLPHASWFNKHHESYSKQFVEAIQKELKEIERTINDAN